MIITLKGADFSNNNIGTLDMWTITSSLTGVTSSNKATAIDKGTSYTTTFTIKDGYTIDENSVFTVNGEVKALTWSSNEAGGTATFTITPESNINIVLKATVVSGGGVVEPDNPDVPNTPTVRKNLFNINDENFIQGARLSPVTGSNSSDAGWNTTGFIPVTVGKSYVASAEVATNSTRNNATSGSRWYLFDENKNYITGYDSNTKFEGDATHGYWYSAGGYGSGQVFNVPRGAYMRVAVSTNYKIETLQIEEGTTPTEYEPYKE